MLKHYLEQKLNTQNSVHDSTAENEYLKYIDRTQPILEFSIIKLFIINLIQLIKNKVALSKNFYISPSEIDKLYYWEYEYMLDEVNETIKKENERNEKEQSKYGNMSPASLMREAKSAVPKMSGYNLPKI